MREKMPVYYMCNLKKSQHMLAYLVAAAAAGCVVYLFYHSAPAAVIFGAVIGIFLEKLYADSTIKKRQKQLRLQFRDFLASMAVAARAGNVEIQALKSAAKDLRLSYSEQSDIIREIDHMIVQYEGGGTALRELFTDFAERSQLTDIRSFAVIYEVIDGKSDRFGDIVIQTHEIIGEKVEVEQEIETGITAAKSETTMMLVLPLVVVLMMSCMGEGLLDALFTTVVGRLTATAALALFLLSFFMAVKFTDIEV